MRIVLQVLIIVALLPASGMTQEEGGRPLLTVGLQAILVSDDDGGRPVSITPPQIERWVEITNRSFAPAGISFQFSPDGRDCSILKNTLINNVKSYKTSDWSRVRRMVESIASRYPEKIVIFFRHGPGKKPAGNAFSWWSFNFIIMPGIKESDKGLSLDSKLAHEIGHYLGLWHTFRRGHFESVAEAQAFFAKKGNAPAIFDGDELSDTPPHPDIKPLNRAGENASLTLNGVPFTLPRRNIMSSFSERDSFSRQQLARARWFLEMRMKNEMQMPSNLTARAPIEAETLTVVQERNCRESTQSRIRWSLVGSTEGWSGRKHLLCRAGRGGFIVFRLRIRRPRRARLNVYATKGPDYGKVRVFFDDKPIGRYFDGYAQYTIPSGRISMGEVNLSAGEHSLGFAVVGKDPASRGYAFAIDCIELVEESEKARDPF